MTDQFFAFNKKQIIKELGKKKLLDALEKMVTIRQFETRAEASYMEGHIGGFFHSYVGQEAIQTAAITAVGVDNWFTTTYRCHALALLLGESPLSVMSELFGKATGTAKGRGGSMHLFSKNLLGGHGIVGGHLAIATGAGYSIKYKKEKNKISLCFQGDGSTAQGTFHESLNLASLLKVPCMFIVENNQWSMGTPLYRTLANPKEFTYYAAKAYGIPHYQLDGMDFFSCYAGIKDAYQTILEKETPVLIECQTERFKGHSISDPQSYRTRDELKVVMKKDSIPHFKDALIEANLLTEDEYKAIETRIRKTMADVAEEADKAPWPDVSTLEQDVYANTSS